eukprot:CAMPEP_0115330056 /NCGR_PEP_ID=MMETSP0270-20121206/85574_1 /TAXON_ID=71861 /ORGANISM="Scrippsiella trochoidea, Strain CCMP3099" /LENGTH=33 /DNA_ID= /DNA_START= /DNA_END= /DNA_ORIENTATION=
MANMACSMHGLMNLKVKWHRTASLGGQGSQDRA